MRTTTSLGLALTLAVAAACGTTSNNELAPAPDGGTDLPSPVTPTVLPDGAVVAPKPVGIANWDDPTAIAWLNKACANCHGIDDAGQQTPYYSAWPMPKPLTREWLETSDYTAAAYQTILHRIGNTPGPPSPMPVAAPANEQERADLAASVDWFTRRVPFSVIDANRRYGNKVDTQQLVTANFQCSKVMSLRKFLTQVTLGLFDRYPTPAETAGYSESELSAPVNRIQREAIVAKLDADWKLEVLTTSMKKLANVIGGAPTIGNVAGITAPQQADLKEEFYRLILGNYDTVNYADLFRSNTVMVSSNTAALYGCTAPAAGTWAPCQLVPPRKTFFTTRAFLASRPSSFLIENNNYGRVALIFFTLYGEKLFAATAGPTGDAISLPSCLEGDDMRAIGGAPRGSAAVALYGAVCQGCHVARGLAAGSVLFRPFSLNGSIYDLATMATASNPDKEQWDTFFDRPNPAKPTETLVSPWAIGTTKLTPAFMTGLLAASTAAPKSCVATGNKAAPYAAVADIAQLVEEYLKNTTSFSRGFTRHAQRAFMNQSAVTLEMSVKASAAYEAGKQKLPDLMKGYFLSDTLTCEE